MTSNPKDSACPSDELLVGYLTADLAAAERQRCEAHLRECDRCVITAAMVQRRLRIGDEVPIAIPDAIAARVRPPVPVASPAAAPVTPARRSDWVAAVREWAGSLGRLPILVPAAVAAVAVLLIVSPPPSTTPSGGSRAVPGSSATLRVTGHHVPVYERPSSRTAEIANLDRGEYVTVRGEDRNWYRVALPDGREGWVEREAFE